MSQYKFKKKCNDVIGAVPTGVNVTRMCKNSYFTINRLNYRKPLKFYRCEYCIPYNKFVLYNI